MLWRGSIYHADPSVESNEHGAAGQRTRSQHLRSATPCRVAPPRSETAAPHEETPGYHADCIGLRAEAVRHRVNASRTRLEMPRHRLGTARHHDEMPRYHPGTARHRCSLISPVCSKKSACHTGRSPCNRVERAALPTASAPLCCMRSVYRRIANAGSSLSSGCTGRSEASPAVRGERTPQKSRAASNELVHKKKRGRCRCTDRAYTSSCVPARLAQDSVPERVGRDEGRENDGR